MKKTRTVLVVDDIPGTLSALARELRAGDYEVLAATQAKEALEMVANVVPDLCLLDVKMPEMDGYELCRELKKDPRFAPVPVIFITGLACPEDIDIGYAAGGVEYINKPFHRTEILARIAAHIELRELREEVGRLRPLALDANPLTGLPGPNSARRAVQEALDLDADRTVIRCDLAHFRAYNERYGFPAGDELLQFVKETLEAAVRVVCEGDAFIGHLGGDEFLLVVPAGAAEELGRQAARLFDQGVPAFYDEEDRARGSLAAANRVGHTVASPLAALFMGGIPLRRRPFTQHLEVDNLFAEVMERARSAGRSNLFLDRRKDLVGVGWR